MEAKKPLRPENFICKTRTCWLWKGALRRDGSPLYITRNVGKDARRVVFEKHVCDLPEKARLEPKCKNPLCVNPDHQKVR